MNIDYRALLPMLYRRLIRDPFARHGSGRMAFLIGAVIGWCVQVEWLARLITPSQPWFALDNLSSALLWGWMAALAVSERDRQIAACETRIREARPVTHRVYQNGVFVKNISDADYEAIRLTLLRNALSLAARQIANLFEVARCVLRLICRRWLLCSLLAVIVTAFVQPDLLERTIKAVQTMTAATAAPDIVQAVIQFGHVLRASSATIVEAVIVLHFLGVNLGFVNVTLDERAYLLRKHCRISGAGVIRVVRAQEGVDAGETRAPDHCPPWLPALRRKRGLDAGETRTPDDCAPIHPATQHALDSLDLRCAPTPRVNRFHSNNDL